jgi:SAM-dependent methyltransferase
MKETEVKKNVREHYGRVARKEQSCCGNKGSSSCCDGTQDAREASRNIGYSEAEMDSVPEGANLGLGCGNPTALASLKEGETVIDLGSGAGFDCFLAANKVGESGRIIGVDMTPEMLEKGRENARQGGYSNVEFRLGEIENLPVADDTADVIISNCVINLAPDKKRVFREAYRALKPGGRIMVSDIVLSQELPEAIKNSIEAYVGCVAGASLESDYLAAVKSAGFKDIQISDEAVFDTKDIINSPEAQEIVESLDITTERAIELGSSIKSIKVSARKAG